LRSGGPVPLGAAAETDGTGSKTLNGVVEQLATEIATCDNLGLLSVIVQARDGIDDELGKRDTDRVDREVALYLLKYSVDALRRTDAVFDCSAEGRTAFVLLGPPREERPVTSDDIRMVQDRLHHSLNAHLVDCLPSLTLENVGVYVGAARLEDDPDVDPASVVQRQIDNSLLEAMRRRRDENPHHLRFLGRVLKDQGVNSVYQPLVNLGSQRVIGYEALTRPPSGPFATPDRMFRAARKNGMLWSLERTCRKSAVTDLPPMDGDQLLFLNVERESFHDPDLLGANFLGRLDRAGLAPSRVVFEVTEHSRTKDYEGLRRLLGQYRRLGFRLAMDDVGAGYSGLQAIAELEPDFLKVDMNLIRDLHLRPIKQELIASIRRFTEKTGTILVAEGVEQPEELVSLSEIGVNCAQGYLFSRPGAPPAQPDWASLSPLIATPTALRDAEAARRPPRDFRRCR